MKHIVDTYNDTVHYTIEIKPNEAVKPSNHLWVVWHLQNAAKQNRKYEDITQSDMVILMINNTSLIKHTSQNWSTDTHKVIGIDNTNCMLDHPTKHNICLRHEIRQYMVVLKT